MAELSVVVAAASEVRSASEECQRAYRRVAAIFGRALFRVTVTVIGAMRDGVTAAVAWFVIAAAILAATRRQIASRAPVRAHQRMTDLPDSATLAA